jgi:hypothetical protein
LILDDYAVTGRARIAAGSAIAVRDEVILWRIVTGRFFTVRKKRFAGGAGIRHAMKFTTSGISCELRDHVLKILI